MTTKNYNATACGDYERGLKRKEAIISALNKEIMVSEVK